MNKIFDCGYGSITIKDAYIVNGFVVIRWKPNSPLGEQDYTNTVHHTSLVLQASTNSFKVNGMAVDKVGFNLLRDKILKKH